MRTLHPAEDIYSQGKESHLTLLNTNDLGVYRPHQATLADKRHLQDRIQEHKLEVMVARQHYHFRRAKAIGNPSVYASVIIDAMDQVTVKVKHDAVSISLTDRCRRRLTFRIQHKREYPKKTSRTID